LVKKFLGEGGKKRVYLAHDTLLDRDVAFALIKTEGLDDVGRDRIAREAKAMGRLGAHPQIVSVFDLGEETDQPYMVTELMGGGDVEGLIEKAPEHRPPLERTLEIGIEVCRGLEFAHSNGIVHRDLKPGNVWLTADGTAKLGDFGLAVALGKSRLTQAGMMVGTVSYMPPEQAMGGEVTPRSDLYSLGAMLYEMVTGRPPFVGDESVAIITQHLNTPPVAPSWHRPDCPPGLEALILLLLDKDVAKRPASAAEVRQTLENLANAPVAAETEGAASKIPVTENPIYRRTFVGRETELRQLQAAYDAATSGHGSLAVVVGEPGIGKTSLTEQLATYCAIRGGKTLVGHCYEEGSLSLPYLPFVEALRSYVLARDPDDLRKDLGTGAGEVARIVSEVRDKVTVDIPPAGAPEDDRWRLLQAVTGFVRNAASVQPIVIVLEDLHDADRGTLDLLLHLSRYLAGARLMLVGTYRDVEVDRAHPLSATLAELRRGQNFLRVPLRGLTAEEVQRMLEEVAQREISWPMAELVHRQTEGNPLFVQEMLRYLVEEGLVAERGSALRRVGDSSLAGRIPEGLRDVIGKRLSRLADQTNQALAIASVIGREFRLDVLQRVANMPEQTIEDALEEASNVAVVEQRSGIGGQLSFRFTHAFFRQTLYEELFAARRIRLHQQVARALESVYGRRVAEHAAELAEHYANSSDPEDLRKAVEYGETAAMRAMAVFAYGEAARHLEQALKAQDVLDQEDLGKRCDLLLALGEAILPGEEPIRAEEVIAREAFELAETLGDSRRASRATKLAMSALMYNHVLGGLPQQNETIAQWAERADRYAAVGSPERPYADSYLSVSFMGRPRGSGVAEGHRYLRRAVEAALAGDDDAAFFWTANLAVRLLLAVEDRGLRTSIAEAVVTRRRQAVPLADAAYSVLIAGYVFLDRGERETAERIWSELGELADQTRDTAIAAMKRETEFALAFCDGRFDEMALAYDAQIAADNRPRNDARAQMPIAKALWHRERYDEAINVLRTGARPGAAARAVLLALHGDLDQSTAVRREIGESSLTEDHTGLHVLLFVFEAALLTRDVDTARVLLNRLTAIADSTEFCVSTARLLGDAAALLGDRDAASRFYELSLSVCARIRFRPEAAITNFHMAELLLTDSDQSRRMQALQHLDFAIAEFRDMKMQPSLERALRHKEVLKA
jgi:hypothetical protein